MIYHSIILICNNTYNWREFINVYFRDDLQRLAADGGGPAEDVSKSYYTITATMFVWYNVILR